MNFLYDILKINFSKNSPFIRCLKKKHAISVQRIFGCLLRVGFYIYKKMFWKKISYQLITKVYEKTQEEKKGNKTKEKKQYKRFQITYNHEQNI